MDNVPTGFTDLYDPFVSSGLIYDPSTNTYIPADSTASTGPTQQQLSSSGSLSNQAFPSPSQLISNLVDMVPGASTIEAILKAVETLPNLILKLVNEVEGANPTGWITSMMLQVDKVGHMLDISGIAEATKAAGNEPIKQDVASALSNVSWNWLTEHTIGNFFTAMLEAGLGVDTSKFDDNAKAGVTTTDNMLGFTFVLQYVVAIADHVGKAIFANRWPESITETIAKIPEEMGLSWALGLVIDESFKTAVGRSLEEGINKQKRGNRIAWQQLRPLLKQHILTPEKLRELLENQGFPDEQIEWLNKLADALLPVGDLQQMYLHGIMTGDQVKDYIHTLGFSDADRDRLYTMYIEKAETESASTLRSTARALFLQNLITEQHYRDILTEVNYAELLIADDIAAVNLVHETGRVQTSLTSIKSQYQHHSITPQVAIQLLKQLNYTDEAITNLFKTWDLPPLLRTHHLSQAKVLSYLVSGLLTPQDATTRLIAMGMDVDDAALLVAHPTASAGVRQHGLTTGMITQAYAEGIIDYGALPGLYTKVGVTDAALQSYLDQAYWKRSHFKQAPDHKNTLTDGDIRAAFKIGLMDQTTATSLLVANGWSADDALLLLEITNKGLITPHVTAFATPQQAVEFLLYYGWTVQGPPDPIFMEAEVAAQTAGFTVSPPAGWDPYNPTIPSGGPPPPLPVPSPLPPPPIGTPPPAPVPLPGI